MRYAHITFKLLELIPVVDALLAATPALASVVEYRGCHVKPAGRIAAADTIDATVIADDGKGLESSRVSRQGLLSSCSALRRSSHVTAAGLLHISVGPQGVYCNSLQSLAEV